MVQSNRIVHVPGSMKPNHCIQIIFFYFCSEDDSELSDNETEQLSKGEELVNGSTNGLTVNGVLSRDGRLCKKCNHSRHS